MDAFMKILLIPEYGRYGGTLSFLKRLLDIHRKQRIETALLIQEGQVVPDAVSLNTRTQVFWMPERNMLSFYPVLSIIYDYIYVRKVVAKFKPALIVVSNGTPGLMLGVLFFRAPVLVIMHTYPAKKLIVPSILMNVLSMKQRYTFMTVSRFSAERIRESMGAPVDRVEVVYNSSKVRDREVRNVANPVVLTIGHLVPYKNPELWLEVARRVIQSIPDVLFVWLGDGEMLELMRRRSAELGLSNNVEYKGSTPDVERFYREAMVYFQPSTIENLSISVLDAMAHALPCVASDAGGLPETVVDGKTGFICHVKDVEGFASRIIGLLSDPSLRERMGKTGRQRVAEFFSEEEQERKIMDIYKRLTTGGDAG